ncbi:MAG: ComF family protein [Thioalkalivibrionaceae bacterium]
MSSPGRPLGPPPDGVERHFSAFAYAWPHAQALLRYKHRLDPRLGAILGEWMSVRLGGVVAERLIAEGVRSVEVVALPLHPSRQAARGGNQALALARGLSAGVRQALSVQSAAVAIADSTAGLRRDAGQFCEVWERRVCLVRSRATPHQRGLDRRSRRRNPSGAFELADGSARDGSGASWTAPDRVVLVVDDVMTTGASLAAAARPLRAAGARVWTASLLRAGR